MTFSFHIVTPNGDVDLECNDEIGEQVLRDLRDWNYIPFKVLLNTYNIDEKDIIEYHIFHDGVFTFMGGKF